MTLTLFFILFFLAAALILYALFGGADLGAGMLEPFLSPSRRELATKAIAPVWEANHVWIILAIVILFMAFPPIYLSLTLFLHLPIMVILFGIVLRGCAFAFRYYDTLTDRHRLYSLLFQAGSYLSALAIGITVGTAISGRINPAATGYYDLYVEPWLHPFPFLVGVFTMALFSFSAAVFLFGESSDKQDRKVFRAIIRNALSLMIVSGGFVLVLSPGKPLLSEFFARPRFGACFSLATLLLYPFFKTLDRDEKTWTRVLASVIVGAVLGGWWFLQYPEIIRYADGVALTFMNAAAPEPTLSALLGALLFGSAIIFPALWYLLKVFKGQTFS